MVTVIIILTFSMVDFSDNVQDMSWVDFTYNDMFTSWSILLYAFSCHPNVLDVYRELKDRSEKRMSVVLKSIIFTANNFYVLVGFFGYVTFLHNYS